MLYSLIFQLIGKGVNQNYIWQVDRQLLAGGRRLTRLLSEITLEAESRLSFSVFLNFIPPSVRDKCDMAALDKRPCDERVPAKDRLASVTDPRHR